MAIFITLIATGAVDQKTVYFQDGRSHSIKSTRSTLWGLRSKSEIVYQTPDFDEQHAQWQEGLKIAFNKPMREGDLIAIKKAGQFYFLRIEKIDRETKEVQVAVKSYGSPWKDVQIFKDSSQFQVPINGFNIMFSYSHNNVYVYSDEYWIKPLKEVYGISYCKDENALTEEQLSRMKFLKHPWETPEQPTDS